MCVQRAGGVKGSPLLEVIAWQQVLLAWYELRATDLCATLDAVLAAETLHLKPTERVIDAVRNGARTWDQIQARTRLNDESLGLALMDLFHERHIQSYQVGEERVYAAR